MNSFDFLHSLNHHAYFIHSFKDAAHKLKEYLKETFGIHHAQNPDFYHEKFEMLGIDESRRIQEIHMAKSFAENGKRIFIIEAEGMTHEAQNALLKIFEEPHAGSHFFLVMPRSEMLLPTLRSRLSIIPRLKDEQTASDDLGEIKKFLKLSAKERIDFVDDIAKRISDEELSKKDAIDFLEKLEVVLYANGLEKNKKALQAVLTARDYIGDRSSSVKQLLEYVALSVGG